MRVKDIMRKTVETLLEDTSVQGALDRMHALGLSSLPVQDQGGSFLGIVTVADLSRRVASAESEGAAPIKNRLSPMAVTATPEMDVGRLAEMMRDRGLDNIMVLEARRLAGTVSLEMAQAGQAQGQAGGDRGTSSRPGA